jgi:hypothetical protein
MAHLIDQSRMRWLEFLSRKTCLRKAARSSLQSVLRPSWVQGQERDSALDQCLLFGRTDSLHQLGQAHLRPLVIILLNRHHAVTVAAD